MKKEFWKDWKNISDLEKVAINSLKSAKKLILEKIPREEIVSIYVKGSFPRREMNSKSDVDTLTVLKHSKYLKKLKNLEKRYREGFEPKIQFAGNSLWELKTGKKSSFLNKDKRASPTRTAEHLKEYKLIYGRKLKKDSFFQRNPEKQLQKTIDAFDKVFLPHYEKGKMGFSDILKQFFWLVENEQKSKGKKPGHSFKEIADSVKNKNHLIHEALKLRKNQTKDKKIRRKFIKSLKSYLNKLEKRGV